MCCDYEEWQDGTFNCYLYSGGAVLAVNENDFPEDKFANWVFPHLNPSKTVKGTVTTEESAAPRVAAIVALISAALVTSV